MADVIPPTVVDAMAPYLSENDMGILRRTNKDWNKKFLPYVRVRISFEKLANGQVELHPLNGRKRLLATPIPTTNLIAVAYTQPDSFVLTLENALDGRIALRSLVIPLRGKPSSMCQLWSPQHRFVTCLADNTLVAWDISRNKLKLQAFQVSITSCAIGIVNDHIRLFFSGGDQVYFWPMSFNAPTQPVNLTGTDLAFIHGPEPFLCSRVNRAAVQILQFGHQGPQLVPRNQREQLLTWPSSPLTSERIVMMEGRPCLIYRAHPRHAILQHVILHDLRSGRTLRSWPLTGEHYLTGVLQTPTHSSLWVWTKSASIFFYDMLSGLQRGASFAMPLSLNEAKILAAGLTTDHTPFIWIQHAEKTHLMQPKPLGDGKKTLTRTWQQRAGICAVLIVLVAYVLFGVSQTMNRKRHDQI